MLPSKLQPSSRSRQGKTSARSRGFEPLEARLMLNAAPTLDPTKNPVFDSIPENAPAPSGPVGTYVSNLVNDGNGLNNYSDPDNDPPGIAIEAVNPSNGTLWSSQDNGTTWNILPPPSSSNPALLRADASTQLYFQPATSFSGEIADVITFRAWDQQHVVESHASAIEGEAANALSGTAVALSADGTTLAIGATGNTAGNVRVFRWHDTTTGWIQEGNTIQGSAADWFGAAVDLSADGTTLIAGAPWNDTVGNNAGLSKVYDWNAGTATWEQRGAAILGEASLDQSGRSVSVSADGQIVAVGAPYNDNKATPDDNAGHARVFRWDSASSTWTQLGTDIDGETIGERTGYAVALSQDGQTLIAGGFQNASNGTDSGHARVFQWDSSQSDWLQMGENLTGAADGDFFGMSVSISSDGRTVAAGAPNASASQKNAGAAYLYQWNEAVSRWAPMGAPLLGSVLDDQFGRSIALSADGQTVAVSSPGDDTNGTNAGKTEVYHWNGSTETWDRAYGTAHGGNAGDATPGVGAEERCIDISGSGQLLAVGVPGHDTSVTNAGQTKVYTVLPSISIESDTASINVDSSVTPGIVVAPHASDVRTEFTLESNPNGPWTYGWKPNLAGAFTAFELTESTADWDHWWHNFGSGISSSAVAGVNKSGRTYNGAPPNAFILHPGPQEQPSIARWTAPATGTITLAGEFGKGNVGVGDAYVMHDGTKLWEALNFNQDKPFSLTIDVQVGDTVDAVVAGMFGAGTTPLELRIGYHAALPSFSEGTAVGTRLAAVLHANAADASSSYSFELVAGDGDTDNASFTLTDGWLTSATSFDYESKSQYAIRIRSTSNTGAVLEEALTVSIADVNEAPTSLEFANAVTSISETTDTSSRTKIADIVVVDDALGSETLTLSGDSAPWFEIDGSELFLAAGVTLDASQTTELSVTVVATDPTFPQTAAVSETHVMTVTFANEQTVEVAEGNTATDENQYSGSEVIVKRGKGRLILNKANTHSGGVIVVAGEVVIRDILAVGTGGLTLMPGAKVVLDDGMSVMKLADLDIDPLNALLDLGGGGVEIAATDSSLLRNALIQGRNGGDWNGVSGIISSSAADQTGLGYVLHADGSSTVRLTANGDTGLDGKVDFDDILALFPNYNSAGDFIWQGGDFTYDGKVDFDDILALFPNYGAASVFGGAAAGLSGGGGSGLGTGGVAANSSSTTSTQVGDAGQDRALIGPITPSESQNSAVLLIRPTLRTTSDATELAFAAIAEAGLYDLWKPNDIFTPSRQRTWLQ
jgi:autotransporter-associated beta strand protein